MRHWFRLVGLRSVTLRISATFMFTGTAHPESVGVLGTCLYLKKEQEGKLWVAYIWSEAGRRKNPGVSSF